MPSFRRVAFSLGLVVACGGAVFFSLSAKGQPVPGATSPGSTNAASGLPGETPAPGGPGASSSSGAAPAGTASPTLRQTIGISPVQTGTKGFVLFGGTGNEDSYDLQNETVYSLLRQRGVPIPNILHPLSTAKPSFILERLIVLSLTGGNSSSTPAASGGNAPSSSSSSSESSGGAAAAAAPAGPSDAELTVSAVRAVVDAEISRGSGRSGGAHAQKLRLLSRAISSLEQANRLGSIVSAAVSDARGGSGSGSAGASTDKSKTDPREILYGQARLYSRRADRFAPTGL